MYSLQSPACDSRTVIPVRLQKNSKTIHVYVFMITDYFGISIIFSQRIHLNHEKIEHSFHLVEKQMENKEPCLRSNMKNTMQRIHRLTTQYTCLLIHKEHKK